MLSHDNKDLDNWFQQLNKPLRRLPVGERTEIHLEVRQHLEALAAANEELGSTPEGAWEHALDQFGDPGKFGRRMAWEWRRGQGWVSPDMAAVLYGIGVHAAASVGLVVLFCVVSLLDYFSGVRILGMGAGWLMTAGYFIGVPAWTGFALGRKFPHRALTGAFYAALALPVLPLLTAALASVLQSPAEMAASLAEAVGIGADLVLVTCGAAYVASARARREWYRPDPANFKLALPRLSQKETLI